MCYESRNVQRIPASRSQIQGKVDEGHHVLPHPASIAAEIVVPPDFGQHQQWGAILPLLSSTGMKVHKAGNPASVADTPAGLSGAELAIAETGSVLLAENSLEARVVSMLTLTHFIFVSGNRLVPMLDDAAVMLQQLALRCLCQHLSLVSAGWRSRFRIHLQRRYRPGRDSFSPRP
jgi:L-lactate dehydrogenase complex protein LldG